MSRPQALAVVVAAVLLGWLTLQWWRDRPVAGVYDGYLDAEVQYFAAPTAAALQNLNVRRGQQVTSGTVLFNLDAAAPQAELAKSRAALTQATAGWQRAQAQRGQGPGVISQKDYDTAQSAYLQAAAQVSASARAVAQMAPAAPQPSLVDDTYFTPGEWVAPNTPVVALLAPQYLKVRFFVPEAALATLAPGQTVHLACDGCNPSPMAAHISYIAPQAEFTPPVLYSQAQRAKLVFLVEAVPISPTLSSTLDLHPGLPVTVDTRG
jgi:HlyD family secretion protein